MRNKLFSFIGIFGFILALGMFAAPEAHAVSWQYYRSITVTSTASVASGTLSSFPMLVSSTLASWKSASNGGNIQNLVTAPNGGKEPADLVFATSAANCTSGSYLNFETESYTSSTGALVDWVNVPTVAAGSVIYVCYDASAVTTDQSHPSATWPSQYASVYHFANPNGLLNASDSTSNANNPTAFTTTGALGDTASSSIIDGGIQMSAPSNRGYVVESNVTSYGSSQSFTYEAWVNLSYDLGIYAFVIGGTGGSGEGADLALYSGASGPDKVYLFYDGGGLDVASVNTVALNSWHQIIASYATSTGNVSIYIDGQFDSSNHLSAYSGGGSNPTRIGDWSLSPSSYPFFGNIDEARISTAPLSSQWVLTEYNNEVSPATFYALGSETTFSSPSVVASMNALFFAGD
jgi:biopolymer transport protein ExbB